MYTPVVILRCENVGGNHHPVRVMTARDMAVGKTCPGGAVSCRRLAGGHTSPTINVAVNGKILGTIVDTGSGYTLIRESAAKRMGTEICKRRNTLSLQGVTRSPLRVLGMTWLEIGVGETKVHKQRFKVVPDHYFSVDLLLGCDVLCQAPLSWEECHVVGKCPLYCTSCEETEG